MLLWLLFPLQSGILKTVTHRKQPEMVTQWQSTSAQRMSEGSDCIAMTSQRYGHPNGLVEGTFSEYRLCAFFCGSSDLKCSHYTCFVIKKDMASHFFLQYETLN